MNLAAVVLAAGKGTRMKSNWPKVLHEVCGKPMVAYAVDAAEKAGAETIVTVVGYRGDEVARVLEGRATIVHQDQQLGTAHALLQARAVLENFKGNILVLCGDTPLVSPGTLEKLVREAEEDGAAAAVLTTFPPDPTGYGRIVRDERGELARIVEQKDAGPDELAIREVNSGIYCFNADGLFAALSRLDADNAQGEYYLTDIVGLYRQKGLKVSAVTADDWQEMLGVNDRVQLARVAKIMRQNILEKLMLAGVTVLDPDTTCVGSEVKVGRDTVIYPFTIIEGNTIIGEECVIGPSTRLVNVEIGSGSRVEQSTIHDSKIGDNCLVGPFAYIRPGCIIGQGVKIGDFVELKKTTVSDGSKVPHLSYLGDCWVGKNVNVGAGTITCNYDGKNKHPTFISDGAFIGSNANLVAPVTVGENAVIGAGSTITKDVPPGALGVARCKQKVYEHWKARKGEKENRD